MFGKLVTMYYFIRFHNFYNNCILIVLGLQLQLSFKLCAGVNSSFVKMKCRPFILSNVNLLALKTIILELSFFIRVMASSIDLVYLVIRTNSYLVILALEQCTCTS